MLFDLQYQRRSRDRGKTNKIVASGSGERVTFPRAKVDLRLSRKQVTTLPDGQISGRAVHLRVQWDHAFADGRSATRAIHATMLVLAVSSGCPTWPPKSSQP